VFNTPGANANAVKELVLCAMLMGSRDVDGGIQWVRQQVESGVDVTTVVEKGKSAFVGPELYKKTLGVIGLGAIGSLVANVALDMGMDVYGYDPFLSVDAALRLMCVVVPVVMLLDILWSLYDRECAWALTILGVSLIALWVCRQELSSMYLGTFVRIAAIVYIVLLAVIAFLTHRIDQHSGKLGKFQVLPASADPLPVYVACALSVAGMVCALISTSVAYYAMWTLAIVVFALAVYYTVKQL